MRFHDRLVNEVLSACFFSDNIGHKMLYCHQTACVMVHVCFTLSVVFICKAKRQALLEQYTLVVCAVYQLCALLGVVFTSFVSVPVLMQFLLCECVSFVSVFFFVLTHQACNASLDFFFMIVVISMIVKIIVVSLSEACS